MEHFAVDPAKPRDYDKRAKHTVRVWAKKVWFDDGYRYALKGDTIKLDEDDFALLVEVGQVAKLGEKPRERVVAPPCELAGVTSTVSQTQANEITA